MRTTLSADDCGSLLQSTHYGHLGCVDGDVPFVFPVTFLYKDGELYSHTHEGAKTDILRRNPNVCLQVERVRTGHDWSSVMCHGRFEEVTDHNESHAIELLLADQYAQISEEEGRVPVSPVLRELHSESVSDMPKDIVYKIIINNMTGVEEVPANTLM